MRHLLISAITGLGLLTTGNAADREAAAQKRKQLLELAAEKKQALIFGHPGKHMKEPGIIHMGIGCFIDADGMAVMSLESFIAPKVHDFYLGGQELKRPKLLYVDPVNMIAVAKFDHKPTVWIEPRKEAMESRKEWAAMLTYQGELPALTGPIWGRWKSFDPLAREPALKTVIELVTGRPAGEAVVGNGCPVIDDRGRLCGLLASLPSSQLNKSISVSPTDAWIDAIDKAREAKEGIAYPLKGKDNPKDPACTIPGYYASVAAMQRGKYEVAMAEVEKAIQDHPESILLKRLRLDIIHGAAGSEQLKERQKDMLKFAQAMKPGAEATPGERAMYLYYLGKGHRMVGDLNLAAECLQEVGALAGGKFAALDYEFFILHQRAGRRDEAIAALIKAAKAKPTSLIYLEPLTQLLAQAGRWEEEQKFTDDIYEVERLTQPVSR